MVAFTIFKLVIYAGLLVLIGYFFVYKVIIKLLERRRIKTTGEAVKATVVDYRTMKDSEGGVRYYPVLRYTTKSGESITVQSRKERYQKYKLGKELTVYYLPEEPSVFYIAGLIPYIKIAGFILGLCGEGLLLFEILKTIRRLLQ